MNSATEFKPSARGGQEGQYVYSEPWGKQHSLLIHAGIFLAIACVFVADLYTPLAIEVWVMYLIPVILSLVQWNPQVPIFVATVATLLMILTFVTDTVGMNIGAASLNRGFGMLTIWTMATMGYFFIRNRMQVNHQRWLQYGRGGLNDILSGELQLHQSGDDALAYLARFLNAQAGVLYIWQDECFRQLAGYGVPATTHIPDTFTIGDGLLGQAALEARSFLVENVPHGYLRIGSALGESLPRSLVIAPMKLDGRVTTVLELGFLHVAGKRETELLDEISIPLCKALRAAKYRQHLQELLEETRRQADELQSQGEELRTSNEELEEQSLSLQHSYEHLEKQQLILEQSNAQLEEQTLQLESQRDDLAHARAAIELKAQELERVSQYKTDFLANMSHELRTPLNSSLILARLLADNSEQNLSHEQVAAAETIVAAGNDLLALINDILDLSRIEAGRMEIHSEPVWLAQLVKNLANAMRPQADHKGLDFAMRLAPDCPETICTDYQRLEQVLRNLLSNAIKFTEEGFVAVDVFPVDEGRVAFAVSDTGIGISEEQHQTVFEAFHQIDSAANRKYSGTGLGLSISKELTRLLGGEISLSSKPNAGSTFTLLLPLAWEPPLLLRQPNRRIVTSQAYIDRPMLDRRRKPAVAVIPLRNACDDRARLDGQSRVILIVEDDEVFASLLGELVHEQHFQCLVASTSDEAMEMAQEYLPSAVILDIGLPDHSGLTVLDRLKVDPRTRHIPVHVVSGSDHAEAAMALGAIGYIQKPATREILVKALRSLETRLVQRMRRVLLVEADADQLDNLRRMLASQDVEMVAVTTAAACLQQLQDSTFDCMVLDLSLPDASGYALLDTLSHEETYAFPPVIVYTGRELPEDEEERLRGYSRSMLIKGATSPESLLDEVTLFLHQVVADLPPDQQRMIQRARNREAALEKRRILIVEDDVRNVFALSSLLEPWGAIVQIARNGREALEVLADNDREGLRTDLVLMDVMMPEMDGITATREIRKRAEWKNLPIIMLTAKAMHDDQESCFAAGANDYMAKPLDVDKLLSLVRVWIRR